MLKELLASLSNHFLRHSSTSEYLLLEHVAGDCGIIGLYPLGKIIFEPDVLKPQLRLSVEIMGGVGVGSSPTGRLRDESSPPRYNRSFIPGCKCECDLPLETEQQRIDSSGIIALPSKSSLGSPPPPPSSKSGENIVSSTRGAMIYLFIEEMNTVDANALFHRSAARLKHWVLR